MGRVIGDAAKRQLATNGERTITSVKRHMGTDWNKMIDGKEYRPQTISAMVYDLVERTVGPVQQAMRDAQQYAGVDSLRREAVELLSEANQLQKHVDVNLQWMFTRPVLGRVHIKALVL